MKRTSFLFFFFTINFLFSQREAHLAFPEKDSLYREDQFYLAATFHIINNRPQGVVQSGFSGGVHLGFIRDIPFTKRRNWALGLGLGYSFNVYNHNLILEQINNKTQFRLPLESDQIENNRFRNQIIEIPIEIRWRTSTPETYKFWRIYGGVRLGYTHSFTYQIDSKDSGPIKIKNPDGLDRMRLGATLTFGFNTFNFHMYYGINPFFDNSVSITNQNGGFSSIKLGLMFYIL